MGTVLPSQCTIPRLALNKKIFRLGQDKISDYVIVIMESDKGISKWLNVVSKCQCKIVLNSTEIFLRENCSKGIWVKSNKLGKDNMWSLLGSNEKMFEIISVEATSDSLLPS